MSESASEERGAELLRTLVRPLSEVDEPERYRLVGKLLVELARQSAGDKNGRGAAAAEVEGLQRRVRTLEEDKAGVQDELRLSQANLVRRVKEHEAEQAEGLALRQVVDSHRERMESVQNRVAELEATLTARNAETHRLETLAEDLQLKFQRAELASADTSKVDALEDSKQALATKGQTLEAQIEELRQAKDAEIEAVKAELVGAAGGGGGEVDALLTALWDRLGRTKPPLVRGSGETPNPQAAERLTDAVIELTTALHELDQDLRPFFDKFTRYQPSIKTPWEAYASQDEFRTLVGQVLARQGGKPAGVMRVKLTLLRRWINAAVFATDGTLSWIASELEAHLLSDAFAGADPNVTARAFLKKDGHHLFMERMQKKYSEMLGDVFAGKSG